MRSTSGEYVLIAEDDVNLRDLLSTIVTEATGLEVGAVQDGEKALARVQEWGDPALVLADICMPNLDGFGLLDAMRQALPNVPMIAMSAVSSADEALSSGYDDFLLKPFDFDDLIGKLERWLPARRPGAEARTA